MSRLSLIFTSYIIIPCPYNLTCQYLLEKLKVVLLKTSELLTEIIYDAFHNDTDECTLIIPTRKL